MGNDLYYKWKNGKVNACEHVQEMFKGQLKFLQPEEESLLLQAYPAIKVLKGGVHTTLTHSLKQAEFRTEKSFSPGRTHDLIDKRWNRHI